MNEKSIISKLTRDQVTKRLIPAAMGGLIVVGLTSFSSLAGEEPTNLEPASLAMTIVPVKLVPQDSGFLKVDEPNKCKKGGHDGCLLFEEKTIGQIRFYLPGSQNEFKTCEDTENVITKIELTTYGADDSNEAKKGVFIESLGEKKLHPWLKKYAFPSVDLNTGIVFEASVETANAMVWLNNQNSQSHEDEGDDDKLSFWYRVTVTACTKNDEGKHATWVTEPRGDNEGKN